MIQYTNAEKLTWVQKLLRRPYSLQNERTIVSSIQDNCLPNNQINTSKYQWWNFIAKNLWYQFSKLPNLYFLIIGILQILPYTSTTNGVPTIYIPLGLIIIFTALKDLYQDYKRSISDESQNNQQVRKMINLKDQVNIKSKEILTGAIIKIMKDEVIPCDGIVIYCSQQCAYVQTKNLDGQTNLKRKYVLNSLKDKFNLAQEITELPKIKVTYEKPNTNMNKFEGFVYNEQTTELLSNQNFLLRSSKLKNTQFILLLALYTGHDSKIILSMSRPRVKKTSIESKLENLILVIFLCLMTIALILGGLKVMYFKSNAAAFNFQPQTTYFLGVFGWILNLTNLIPISLIVTLETVKLLQGKIIARDQKMSTDEFPTLVNCSNLTEELGVIDCIASDKTGTLTKNNLKLINIFDGLTSFTQSSEMISQSILQNIGLCNQASVNLNSLEYECQSQDELCILNFCKRFEFVVRFKNQHETKLSFQNSEVQYRILNIIEFTSQRKIQTTIYQKDSKIYIVTKGADDQMQFRIVSSQLKKLVFQNVDQMAKSGLRTLVYGYNQLDRQYYDKWNKLYKQNKFSKNVQEIKRLEFEIQNNLNILCSTAIEDQLQECVGETIKLFLKAGIRFLIISGDKPETVYSIAKNLNTGIQPYLAKNNTYLPQYDEKKYIVFARCTPKQKSQIVSTLKGKTLAIGDGANDVSMIINSNVGVGVYGKQGKAVLQAADFCIPSFKYLKRLVFYYGSQNYRKNATIVRYNFYKNFVYTIPQIVFAFYSGFSGIAIYQSYLSQLYNLLFTTLPVFAFALFDQNQEQEDIENNLSNQYDLSRKRTYFRNKQISFSLIEACLQTVISSVICFKLIPLVYVSPQELHIYETSSILFLYVVIIVNLNILFESKRLSLGFGLTVVLSLAFFFVSFQIFCSLSLDLKNSYNKIVNTKSCFIVFLCLIISFLFSLVLNIITTVGKRYSLAKLGNKIFEANNLDSKFKPVFQISI